MVSNYRCVDKVILDNVVCCFLFFFFHITKMLVMFLQQKNLILNEYLMSNKSEG